MEDIKEKEEYSQPEKELMRIQYDKLSDDWRHFNTIIWGVPSVAIAIVTGIILAAYRPELEGLPRIIALSIGSLFLFALTIELVKKRLHMNAISFLLNDLQVSLGLPKDFLFPLGIKQKEIEEAIMRSINKGEEDVKYSKQIPLDFTDNLFKFFQKYYARKYLTYVIFVSAVLVALLSIVEAVLLIINYLF